MTLLTEIILYSFIGIPLLFSIVLVYKLSKDFKKHKLQLKQNLYLKEKHK